MGGHERLRRLLERGEADGAVLGPVVLVEGAHDDLRHAASLPCQGGQLHGGLPIPGPGAPASSARRSPPQPVVGSGPWSAPGQPPPYGGWRAQPEAAPGGPAGDGARPLPLARDRPRGPPRPARDRARDHGHRPRRRGGRRRRHRQPGAARRRRAHAHRRRRAVLAVVAAAWLMRRPATDARTWGYRRAEVLAAAAQAAVLLAVGRLRPRRGRAPAVRAARGRRRADAGLRGRRPGRQRGRRCCCWPRAATTTSTCGRPSSRWSTTPSGSVAVLVAAAVIATTGWIRADAVASLVIGVLIVPRTLRLLRESVDVLLESTPRGLDLDRRPRAASCACRTSTTCTTCTPPRWPPGCPSSPRTWWSTTPLPRRAPGRDARRAAVRHGRLVRRGGRALDVQLEPVGHSGHEAAAHPEALAASCGVRPWRGVPSPAPRRRTGSGQTRNSTSSWLTTEVVMPG